MTENNHNKRLLFWLFVGVLALVFIYLIRAVLLPFVLGMFIAYFLHPAVDKLERLKIRRGVSTLLVMIVFFLAIALLGILIVPVIGEQLSGLLSALPGYISDFDQKYGPALSDWLGGLPGNPAASVKSALSDFSGMAIKFGGEFITDLFRSGMAILTLLSLILITPVVAFYLLRDWHHLTTRMDDLLPRNHARAIRQQLSIIDRTLAGFVRGQLNVCLIMGTYYATGLSLAGLKFGAVIGLLTGFLVIFPYVGLILGMTVGLSVAFFQFDTASHIMAVLAVFMAGTIMESSLITPKLVGEKVGLHPVWIIFGMLSGAALFGFVGVLLAVPATAVIGVLIRFATQQYLESDYYQGDKPTRKK